MSDENFAEMFAKSEKQKPKAARTGERVSARIVSVGPKRVMLDLGDGVDGMMEIVEFQAAEIEPKVGDTVDGFVMRVENRVAIVGKSVQKGQGATPALEHAAQAKLPVEGLVSGVNKGGYVVEISGVRCFCPLGQMDVRRIEDPAKLVGQRFHFVVTEAKASERGGKDFVLSRRVLLEQEARGKRDETVKKLAVGENFEGTVTNVRDFGAFIDLGGIEGLLPVSEMGFGRQKAQDAVQVGQRITVQVIKLEGSKDGAPERITLSVRALMQDPFMLATAELAPGMVVTGTVTRIQPFGAFVELAKGVEGLIHVSQFGKRVQSPSEVVKEGSRVSARVEKVEAAERRIGLAYVDAEKAAAFTGSQTTSSGITIIGRDQTNAEQAETRKSLMPLVGDVVEATVDKIEQFGVFVSFANGRGLVPTNELGANVRGHELRKAFPVGTKFKALVLEVRPDGKIRLSKKATENAEEKAEAEAFFKAQAAANTLGTLGDKLKNALKK
ncbi:MAG: S1 RNA-binding domain-containing protein [Deltaproteobacteria bacterium]|nr:S1 RNA-binding domain-containing protein [Deltaproteobacteria bacterium]